MKHENLPLASSILFFICITLLFIYLLGMRLYSPLPTAVFWLSVITGILVIVFQIVSIPWPGYKAIIIVEILMLGMALHTTYVIPVYGSQSTDAIRYINVVEQVLEHGIVMPDRVGAEGTAAWPLMLIWISEFHHITGIALPDIMKWVPSIFISSAFIFLLYVFLKEVFKSEKISLLAVLLMLTLPHFIWEGSAFKAEMFAWVLMLTGISFLVKMERGRRVECVGLFILCLAGVIFAHHVTPLLLLIFLIFSLATNRILGLLGSRLPFPLERSTLAPTLTLLLLAFIGTFSYWIYVYDMPLEAITDIGRTLLYGQLGQATYAEAAGVLEPAAVISVRGKILLWGHYFFYAVFVAVLLRGLFSRPKDRPPEFYSFVALLFLCGIWGFGELYFMPRGAPGFLGVGRTARLGWVWGFAPLAICVLSSKRRLLKQAGIMILVVFMLFNIYNITPAMWDFHTPGKLQSTVLKEDYALAESLPLPAEGTGHRVLGAGYKASNMPILQLQGMQLYYLNVLGLEQLERMKWIVVRKPELRGYLEKYPKLLEKGRTFRFKIDVLYRLEELVEGSSPGDRNRIYDSNNLVVFQ